MTQIDNPSARKRKSEYSVEWYTPADLLKRCLGVIAPHGKWFDPCTSDAALAYQAAHGVPAPDMYYTANSGAAPDADAWDEHAGGLPAFINPPYGRGIERWLEAAYAYSGDSIVLVPNSTDVAWWQWAAARCDALVLLRGRIAFIDGSTGRPVKGNSKGSTLFLFSKNPAAVCYPFKLEFYDDGVFHENG